MSICEYRTRISHRWLERKTKRELASIIMANIDKIELFADEKPDPREQATADLIAAALAFADAPPSRTAAALSMEEDITLETILAAAAKYREVMGAD